MFHNLFFFFLPVDEGCRFVSGLFGGIGCEGVGTRCQVSVYEPLFLVLSPQIPGMMAEVTNGVYLLSGSRPTTAVAPDGFEAVAVARDQS